MTSRLVRSPSRMRGASGGPPALALAALALGVLCAATPARAELAVPPLTGPVVDTAGLLDRNGAARLARLAEAARRERGGAGVQLQFLLVPSLEGEPIEDYSIRVAEAWKIGSRASDNGVLVLLSRDDRVVRIEVGGGICEYICSFR